MNWFLRLSVLCLAWLLSAPGLAQPDAEQTLVLLPVVGGSPDIPAEIRASGQAALVRTLASSGYRVIVVEQLSGAPESLDRCETGPCVAELRRLANADGAAALALWSDGEFPQRPTHVVVSLIDGDDNSFDTREDLTTGLDAAIRDAVATVDGAYRVGPGPFLFVDATPEEALVRVDGGSPAPVPYRERIEPGGHRVEVSAPGYGTQVREVTIPSSIAATVRETFDLAEGASDGGGSVLNWVIAAGFVGLSVPFLVSSVQTLARDGECTQLVGTTCEAFVSFGTQSGIFLGIGAASLVAAAIFAIGQPIRVGVTPTAGGAALLVHGDF